MKSICCFLFPGVIYEADLYPFPLLLIFLKVSNARMSWMLKLFLVATTRFAKVLLGVCLFAADAPILCCAAKKELLMISKWLEMVLQ